MSTKNRKKFVPKSGNPAKRAQELEAHKLEEERIINKQRADKAYTTRMDENNYKPTEVGGVWTPPDFIQRIEQLEAPQTKPKKKEIDKRKIWGGVIGFFALGAMVFSGMAGLESAFSPAQQQFQQQNQNANQQGQMVDENGNPILVDVYGNPLDGQNIVPQEGNNNDSQVIDSQVVDSETFEIPAQPGNPPANESNTEDKK